MFLRKWEDYDPTWIIETAITQYPEHDWLEGALKECVKVKRESDFYFYFIDKSNPNKPGSEWQFQESITIEGSPEGDVVIDVIKANRIGGFEFLSKLMEQECT